MIIYNSRNYLRLLNFLDRASILAIYNSRNYLRLLNELWADTWKESTTVEII